MFNKNSMNIAKFDFLNTMRSKGYIILNVILCVLIIVAVNISAIINFFKSSGIIHDNDYELEIYDSNGRVYDSIIKNLDKEIFKSVQRKECPTTYTFDSIGKKVVVINVLEDKEMLYDNVQVITKDTVSNKVYDYIKNSIYNARDNEIQAKYNMDEIDKLSYKSSIVLEETILSTAKNQDGTTQILTTIIGYIIFMLVMTITTSVASGIANEKTSRSAEYILSAVPSKDYLNGKVIAANLKTLLTIILIIFYALIALVINQVLFVNSEEITNLNQISLSNTNTSTSFNGIVYILIVLFMIIITNTLISYIQAHLASKIKSVSELDSVVMLPTVILAIAYFVSNVIFDMPNTLIYVASSVPILSMFILPTAYMLNKVNLAFVIFSFAILVIALAVCYKIVAKKFKNNILDLGNKAKEKEEDEALKRREQEENKIQKKKLSKYIMCTAFTLILSLVLANVLGLLPYMVKSENLMTILNIAVFMVYVGVPAVILSKMLPANKKEKDKNNRKNNKLTMYFIGLVGLVVAQIVNILIVNIFNIPIGKALEQATALPNSTIGIILHILQLAIVPAIFEELLFRKVMLNGAKNFGSCFAIIFTAIMFGLFHQNLQQIFGAVISGVVLGYVTLKTGDIKTAITLHFTNNFFACLQQAALSASQNSALKGICIATIWTILILCIIGIILTIRLVICNKDMLKLKREKHVPIKFTAIFSNFYMILLLVCIISTVVLYLKI